MPASPVAAVYRPLLALLATAALLAANPPATAAAPKAAAPSTGLAATPPLGWNSWDAYGMTISGDEFKRSVDWFHAHLQPFGWQYAIIDEGWYLQHPEKAGKPGQGFTIDATSRYIPDPARFPGGLRILADYTHAQGLKFGIHLIRGIPREAVEKNLAVGDGTYHAQDAADTTDKCRWNEDNYGVKDNAAGRAYYDSLGALYAEWGVDYLKIDCISSPYNQHEIHMVSSALKKSGRPIVLSLSPGPTPLADADDVAAQANLWRISDDFWDVWTKPDSDARTFPQTMVRQFKVLADWEPHDGVTQGNGHWADADMLPIGYLGPHPGWGEPRVSRLTFDEQRTLLTLWSIARSPLVLGANLLQMDSFTESLLTNPEVLAVDQHSSGNAPLVQEEKAVVWRAQAADGKATYLAVFNLDDTAAPFTYSWKQLGVKGSRHAVRDLWLHQDAGRATELKGNLPAHGAGLFRVQ